MNKLCTVVILLDKLFAILVPPSLKGNGQKANEIARCVIAGKTTKKTEMSFPAEPEIEIKFASSQKLDILLCKKKYISSSLRNEGRKKE